MAGRFPGAASVGEFWRNVLTGVESISVLSDEELRASGVDARVASAANFVRAAAVIDDVDRFDAAFFAMSAREAETMDPQHRVFLEVAWAALEAAGDDPQRFPGLVGVYASVGIESYLFNMNLRADAFLPSARSVPIIIGNEKDYVATR